LTYSATTFGNTVDLVLFPETASIVPPGGDPRKQVVDAFWDIATTYGHRVAVGLESGEVGMRTNEVVLIDRLGEVGSYEKQRLVPCQSIWMKMWLSLIVAGNTSAPVWTMQLSP
jgi:apolipoprotein N-acyltransferase